MRKINDVKEAMVLTNHVEPYAKPAWMAVVSLSAAIFGLVTAEFLPASLLTPISETLNVSTGLVGQTVTATAVVAGIAGPGVILGTKRFDRKFVLLCLTGLLIASSLISAYSTSLGLLIFARLLLGVGLGGFWAMSGALAMRLAPGKNMPRAMAIILTGVSLATVCAAPLGVYIGETLGWRSAFLMTAAVGFVTFIIQLFSVPSLPPVENSSLSSMADLLRRPVIRVGLIATLFIVGGHFIGFTYIRPFLESVPKLDVNSVSLVLLAYGIAGFFGNLFGGFVSGRSSKTSVIISASLIFVAAVAILLGGTEVQISAVFVAVWGFAFGAFPVSVQSYFTQLAPENRESIGALVLATFQIAISLGAIAGGLLTDSIGAASIIWGLGIANALAVLAMLWRPRPRSSQPA